MPEIPLRNYPDIVNLNIMLNLPYMRVYTINII